MTIPPDSQRSTFGYLLVIEDDLHGFTGGLLLVCDRGRPLEFHCTEPVRPSRAEQILFGPTLREHLCGELIGGALLSKAKLPIGCLLTLDEPTALAGRATGVTTHVIGEGDETPQAVQSLAAAIDPAEPFERVREAIREAQRLSSSEPGSPEGATRAAA